LIRASFQSVRARLWSALALLSLAVICISATTWLSLERVDKRLQELHRQTLSQVAQALELSKRSTDLATSAPYLLNQRSNFLIKQEGQLLLQGLDDVSIEWPTTAFGDKNTDNDIVSDAIERVSKGVSDLIAASTMLDLVQAETRGQTSKLSDLREQATLMINDTQVDDGQRLIWWNLHSMTSDVLNAANAGNLLGVGEEHRHFLGKHRTLAKEFLTPSQTDYMRQLDYIVDENSGVFELRRRELSTVMGAQNALFRIRHDAGLVSTSASNFAIAAEQFLATERSSSSSTIQLTKFIVVAIALASLFLALISALYVSRYVTFNMARISAAMVQLAQGDRSSSLPRKFPNRDEIGDLFRSFRSFRANALRLDRSNRQLDQRNTLFQKVFINISDGIAITDNSGKITAQNPAMESILDFDTNEQVSYSFIDLLKGGRFGEAATNAGLEENHRGYCELLSNDGQFIELRASRLPDAGRVWLCTDVTERRKLTDRLQQIDRIEALGKVAGDTAHDFGNILSTIGTHAHLLDVKGDKKSQATLSAIVNAIEYGSTLTQRLLAFAKKQQLTPEVIDLNTLVEGMLDLVEISLQPGVELKVTYTEDPILILVDPGQLESSLLNIVLNANQAIVGVGEISITLGLTPEKSAFVTIKDTGTGMPTEILNRVVEPFFTTRAADGGTGLGLSIVYGFIRQTGGDLKVSSDVGKGTTIDMTLPLATTFIKIKETFSSMSVLLVEDEQEARTHARQALKALGFQVTDVSNGQAALHKMNTTNYDLIVSDLDLGTGISGWQLVNQFIEQNTAKHAIVVSGRLSEMDSRNNLSQTRIHCLEKPLNPIVLGESISKIFDKKLATKSMF
jgi:nitrogen fixation/metabolism regulation signal transduction histidine kinase